MSGSEAREILPSRNRPMPQRISSILFIAERAAIRNSSSRMSKKMLHISVLRPEKHCLLNGSPMAVKSAARILDWRRRSQPGVVFIVGSNSHRQLFGCPRRGIPKRRFWPAAESVAFFQVGVSRNGRWCQNSLISVEAETRDCAPMLHSKS